MSTYFACALWAQLLRVPGAILAALAALVLLTAAAPVQQPCSEPAARYLVRQRVERQQSSNGTQIAVPIGMAVAWSCVSRAEAEAELARQIARIEH